MEIKSTIILIALILIVVLPFMIANMRKKMWARKFNQYFHDLARKEGLKFSKHEIWHKNYAIALDSSNKKLLYLKKDNSETVSRVVDLKQVEKCKIDKTDILDVNRDGTNPESYKLDLILNHRNGTNTELVLEFYNNASFMPVREDYEHIRKWHEIITEHIKY
jgi:hypothetical protein